MLSGRCYRLTSATLGVDVVEQKRVATPLPAGSIIHVIRGPSVTDPLIEVECDGKRYMMFVVDLKERGEEVDSTSA